MAVLDRFKPTETKGPDVETPVQKRLDRGRERHKKFRPYWAEQLAFWQGRQFVFRDQARGILSELSTTEGGTKPTYRARTVRNRILGYVTSEVSMATQRTPGYEVTPTTNSPQDINAARLSEKVLLYLFDFLRLRKWIIDAYTYAVVCGEGFLRPYWNPNVGELLPPEPCPDCGKPAMEYGMVKCAACGTEFDNEKLHEGQIAIAAYGPNEVFWEAGISFDQSPWHAIETAMTVEQVKQLPGFLDVSVKMDVQGQESFITGQLQKGAVKADMVMVTEYLELPSDQHEKGRRLFIAGGQVICKPEDYPLELKGPNGFEPCLLKISYLPTPDRDRDMGLVEHLIDPQRTINDSVNKAIEWKNLALAPQILAPKGSKMTRPTAEPGLVISFEAINGIVPKFRDVPPIPSSLFQMIDQAVGDMEEISSQRGLPDAAVSGREIAARTETDQIRRQFIIAQLADAHGRLGHVMLALVQRYFTEPKMLQIEGPHGLEFINDFKGADLRGQLSVRVLPGSIEPRTRAAIEQKIMNFAQLQWITPEQAMSAMNDGTAESLIESFELDKGRAQRILQRILAGPEQFLSPQNNPDGTAAWMPRKGIDNVRVHRSIFTDYAKTQSFELQQPPVQQAVLLYLQALDQIEADEQAQAAAAQSAQAEQLGMNNAAKLQTAKPMASQPALNPGS